MLMCPTPIMNLESTNSSNSPTRIDCYNLTLIPLYNILGAYIAFGAWGTNKFIFSLGDFEEWEDKKIPFINTLINSIRTHRHSLTFEPPI